MHRTVVLLGPAALIALAFAATPALASHYVVDLNGGGDFTTIRAAIHAYQTTGLRDTVFVMPGAYAEDLVLDAPSTVIGVGGPGATSVQAGRFVNGISGQIEGFEFKGDVTFDLDFNPMYSLIQRCVFRGTVFGPSPSLIDCDFYGRTQLSVEPPSYTRLHWLRFHTAPLYLHYYNGPLTLSDFSFEGPADTLLYIPDVTQGDPVTVRNCSFENARFGLVLGEGFDGIYSIEQCSFAGISESAIWHDDSVAGSEGSMVGAWITGSRFERCGTAVRWRDLNGWGGDGSTTAWGAIGLAGDTILSCARDAVVLGPVVAAEVYGCIVEGGAGRGVVFRQERPAGTLHSIFEWEARASYSIFTNNAGAGLVFEDSTFGGAGDWPFPKNSVLSCTFSRNRGPGLVMGSGKWSIDSCVALENDGDGFALCSTGPDWPARLTSNTSVFNRGDGFRLTDVALPGDSLVSAQRNLAAMNSGAGFRLPAQSFGSFAFNDAWGNYLAPYLGAWGSLDSNLTVNPRFCDLSAGDLGLGLEQGSPCGLSGVYGLIGARPEECPNTAAVGPGAPHSLAFAVRPSVARGVAEFVPPATGGDGVVELFDLAGRVVWRSPLGPATGVVRWRGEGESGRVHAGLYWARFTRGSERATQRLVWLE